MQTICQTWLCSMRVQPSTTVPWLAAATSCVVVAAVAVAVVAVLVMEIATQTGS